MKKHLQIFVALLLCLTMLTGCQSSYRRSYANSTQAHHLDNESNIRLELLSTKKNTSQPLVKNGKFTVAPLEFMDRMFAIAQEYYENDFSYSFSSSSDPARMDLCFGDNYEAYVYFYNTNHQPCSFDDLRQKNIDIAAVSIVAIDNGAKIVEPFFRACDPLLDKQGAYQTSLTALTAFVNAWEQNEDTAYFTQNGLTYEIIIREGERNTTFYSYTAYAAGSNSSVGSTDVFSAGAYHTVFVREDGTVGAVGRSSDKRTDVSNWKDVIAVSAFSHTVGLKEDGTVYATGKNGDGQCNVTAWKNIVDIAAGYNYTVGLRADGTVVATGNTANHRCDVSGWTDIVDIAAGEKTTYGLKKNGTVVAVGSNSSGQQNISGWSDITQISAGYSHIVGLRADGTVEATGSNSYGQCNVDDWTDIVAVSAGFTFTLGLKSDGTVVATGDNSSGQCNVGSWDNIVAISAGQHHSIGMSENGGYVSAGSNAYGQCDLLPYRISNQ